MVAVTKWRVSGTTVSAKLGGLDDDELRAIYRAAIELNGMGLKPGALNNIEDAFNKKFPSVPKNSPRKAAPDMSSLLEPVDSFAAFKGLAELEAMYKEAQTEALRVEAERRAAEAEVSRIEKESDDMAEDEKKLDDAKREVTIAEGEFTVEEKKFTRAKEKSSSASPKKRDEAASSVAAAKAKRDKIDKVVSPRRAIMTRSRAQAAEKLAELKKREAAVTSEVSDLKRKISTTEAKMSTPKRPTRSTVDESPFGTPSDVLMTGLGLGAAAVAAAPSRRAHEIATHLEAEPSLDEVARICAALREVLSVEERHHIRHRLAHRL
jgi:hypothetical protein